MPFLSSLVTRRLDSGEWVLESPLWYQSGLLKSYVRVPEGFTTDFASVPRLPLIFTVLGDRGHMAAVIHDYLYTTQEVSRTVADAVFFEALKETESSWRAWAMWLGVRVGGWWVWSHGQHSKKGR